MKLVERLHRIVVTRIKHLSRIQEIAAEGFEKAGSPRHFVRRMEVVGWVGDRMNKTPSVKFSIDVRLAVEALGWQPVNIAGRAYYRGIKPKALSHDEALKRSREDIERGRYGAK